MEGKVVCLPGLEDGWVQMSEGFSKWHEANPVKDHAPHAPLHDALTAHEDCQFGAGLATKDQATLVVV